MKNIVKLSSILSWTNMIVWGLAGLMVLLAWLATRNVVFLIIFFLLSAILLHSYAALKLHKSIRDPAIPLGNQTPTGIRFIGLVALFFGIYSVANSLTALLGAKEVLKTMQEQMPQMKEMKLSFLRASSVVSLILSLCIVLNVFLNFRLLRWYYFTQAEPFQEEE